MTAGRVLNFLPVRAGDPFTVEAGQLDVLIGAFDSIERPLTADEEALLLGARIRRRRNNRPPTAEQVRESIDARLIAKLCSHDLPDPEGERRVRHR